jgi:aminoglycoside 2''-phosphotransferase
VKKLNKELRLLDDLRKRLSLSIPNYEYSEEEGGSPFRSFAGYKRIPGIPADISETVSRKEMARQLGPFLHELHSYPVDLAVAAGVPEVPNLVSRYRRQALSELPRITDLGVGLDDLRLYVENEASPVAGTPSLVHNDLWAEHILVNRSGSIGGVIDWGDAIIGDPAIDFAGLYACYGKRWTEKVIECYPGKLDSAVLLRSRYLAAGLAIHNIALGQDVGRKKWVKAGKEALRRIFAARSGLEVAKATSRKTGQINSRRQP